jgi:multiple sugar transport system substrate-binding protein
MKSMKKSLTLFALVFVMLAMVVAGCSNSNNGGNNVSSGTTDSKGSKDSGSKASGTTEILFWTPFSGADGPFMKQMVDKYNASQDEYKVNFVIQPSGEYYKQLDVVLSAGKDSPDIAILHVDQVPTYVNKGQLQALDGLAVSANINKADFSGAPIEYSTIDGDWYGIPLDIHPLVMYYNKDLFEKAGIEGPPTNREEFEDAVAKLTDSSAGEYGYVVPTLWPQQFIFPTLVWQNGGELWDGSDVAYNSPEAVEMVEWMRSLIDKGYSPGDVQQDGENTLFLQGKNAIQFNGPWMKGQFDEAGLNFGLAPVPQIGKAKQAVFAGSHSFVVPANVTDESKLAGAGDFLKYVSENAIDWAISGQALASKPMQESAEFKALPQSAIVESFPHVQFAPNVLNWGTIIDPVWGELNEALLGSKSAQQALDDAVAKSKQAMND